MTDHRERCQRAVVPGTDVHALRSSRTVSRIHLLFFPVKNDPDRSLCLTRERDRVAAVGTQR